MTSGVATFAGDRVEGSTQYDVTPGLKVDLRAEVHGLDKVTRGDLPGFATRRRTTMRSSRRGPPARRSRSPPTSLSSAYRRSST